MKICTKCNKNKKISGYRKYARSNDNLTSWCKECFAEYDRKRYQNGDKIRKETNNLNRRLRNKAFIKDYLQNNPCVECGDSDWWALDFDHIDQKTKHKEITYFISENGIKSMKEEIKKCRVLCVKCHRKRTIQQLGWWRAEAFTVDDV